MIEVATVCSGIGSPEVAIEELGVEHVIKFACDIDKYARASYLANFKTMAMYKDMTKESWIGEQYYSDLFIGGIPCQAFSLAGKRLGELDKRGLLFYDFYRYVNNQRPKAFIIENVKGLLSDNGGKTFHNWLLLLGDSVNGHHQMFNHPDSLGYNLHHTVLNAKDFGLPQNRERVFIIGIRSDLPNIFRFPAGVKLNTRLIDVLEPVVDEKYYLSETALNYLLKDSGKWSDRLSMMNTDTDDYSGCITANHSNNVLQLTDGPKAGRIVGRNPENPKSRVVGEKRAQTIEVNENSNITNCLSTVQKDNIIIESAPKIKIVLQLNTSYEKDGRVYSENGIAATLTASSGGFSGRTGLYLVSEATKKKYAEATEGDSINLSNPKSDTRRGRVGSGVANTLDTSCNQAVVTKQRIRKLTPLECWRLQGFPDVNFYRAKEVPTSDSQLYKQAGNSMATKVMKAIIKNLLPILE